MWLLSTRSGSIFSRTLSLEGKISCDSQKQKKMKFYVSHDTNRFLYKEGDKYATQASKACYSDIACWPGICTCVWARVYCVYTCALHVRFPKWWYHVIFFLNRYIALFSSLLFTIDKSNNTLNSVEVFLCTYAHKDFIDLH